jgi:hypothetical protein
MANTKNVKKKKKNKADKPRDLRREPMLRKHTRGVVSVSSAVSLSFWHHALNRGRAIEKTHKKKIVTIIQERR